MDCDSDVNLFLKAIDDSKELNINTKHMLRYMLQDKRSSRQLKQIAGVIERKARVDVYGCLVETIDELDQPKWKDILCPDVSDAELVDRIQQNIELDMLTNTIDISYDDIEHIVDTWNSRDERSIWDSNSAQIMLTFIPQELLIKGFERNGHQSVASALKKMNALERHTHIMTKIPLDILLPTLLSIDDGNVTDIAIKFAMAHINLCACALQQTNRGKKYMGALCEICLKSYGKNLKGVIEDYYRLGLLKSSLMDKERQTLFWNILFVNPHTWDILCKSTANCNDCYQKLVSYQRRMKSVTSTKQRDLLIRLADICDNKHINIGSFMEEDKLLFIDKCTSNTVALCILNVHKVLFKTLTRIFVLLGEYRNEVAALALDIVM